MSDKHFGRSVWYLLYLWINLICSNCRKSSSL